MRVFLETYGCQMNEYDTELVRSILVSNGYEMSHSVEEAQVVLINTCAVRENAHRKIYGRLDTLRPLKKRNNPFVVGLLGCMAQNLKEELFDHPVVNLIVGPDNYRSLPRLIDQAIKIRGRDIETYLSEYETYSDIVPARIAGVTAWVAVMRGCDNFCSFCVVPYTRGRERSRPLEDILGEVQVLAEEGYKQVTLLGQNVNSYRDEKMTFADLIVKVADTPGIERVRFTSPHPKDFPDSLLEAIAHHPRICKHIHLPLQAGSDRILERMNRTYTRKEFLDLVEKIRSRIPEVTLTTDLIVGFPTETEEDFNETISVMKRVRFDSAYIFKYSERRGTLAARRYPDDVPPEVKTDRIVRLFELQRPISLAKNREKIGETVKVLVEGAAEKRPDHQTGKTDGGTTVIFPGTVFKPGTMADVQVREATATTLYGVAREH